MKPVTYAVLERHTNNLLFTGLTLEEALYWTRAMPALTYRPEA